MFFRKSNYDRNSLFCLSFFLIQNLSTFETEAPRAEVRSQQMVTTPITELYSDIIQKDRGYEPDFSI